MQPEYFIGWDVGGAHLKLCLISSEGDILRTEQVACPLWKGIEQLHLAIKNLSESFIFSSAVHAVTMTGELADNFKSRHQGVEEIVSAIAGYSSPEQLKIFAGKAGFLGVEEVSSHSNEIASANWLASATWLARKLPSGLLIDIGSTTTDIIPFANGQILTQGYTDQQRMIAGELVYSGIARTPLMAVTKKAPLAGEWVPLMAELFATTADIYRILEKLPEYADQYPAADGKEKTRSQSMRRLARMIGADKEEYSEQVWYELTEYFSEQQKITIQKACEQIYAVSNLPDDAPIIAAGTGRFLVADIAKKLQRRNTDFKDYLNIKVAVEKFDSADCAPAVAVALLALESK
ncbi:MAG TPA: H4MPT-linked C1 transfer pathway protein [Chromatiales bacterium]|nr:H4MPT-linked C1 transfer pathway protein [Thiotrichales bacterium]HIP69611.1 H4MPT-linked C1 transfer pathway protein [Chromatiales bacterium]